MVCNYNILSIQADYSHQAVSQQDMQTQAVTSVQDGWSVRQSTHEHACMGIAVDGNVRDRQAAHQVINAQLLQLQHDRAQVRSKDLWVGLLL